MAIQKYMALFLFCAPIAASYADDWSEVNGSNYQLQLPKTKGEAKKYLARRAIELNSERNRILHILKSRGMAHSNQVREFLLTPRGIELQEAYIGPEGVLTGSARMAQEAKERFAALMDRQDIERKRFDLERKRTALDAQIAALRTEFAAEEEELKRILTQEALLQEKHVEAREEMAHSRKAEVLPAAIRQRKVKQRGSSK